MTASMTLVERLDALEKRVRSLNWKEPVPDELQSEVRMVFNEALAGGANMNGDAGPTLSPNHALDCVWATQRIAHQSDAIETAEKALTVGTPVRCVADECPAEWREDWREWTGFIAGIHYEPSVGLNYTVSDVWPPEHNGDLSDGFREGQLVRDNR